MTCGYLLQLISSSAAGQSAILSHTLLAGMQILSLHLNSPSLHSVKYAWKVAEAFTNHRQSIQGQGHNVTTGIKVFPIDVYLYHIMYK